MLGEVDFTREGFPCPDGHFSEVRLAAWSDCLAPASLEHKVEPLAASVAIEREFLAGVVGDGDHCDDGFASEVLAF